jgi:hypothetical protein
MNVQAIKSETQGHLESYANLDSQAAERLVEALCDAAQAELLGMVSGGEPYPSSMSDLRALRLRYMCQAAERLLTTQEVAVLFRTTDGGADNLLTRMEVLYPAAVVKYLAVLVATSGRWKEAGQPGAFRYLIEFEQLGAWQHAISMLRQAGCTEIRGVRAKLTIEPPRTIETDGTKRDTREILGLPANAKRP